ncbi:hypothetical protein GN958_ATG13471 [Phytophthora infestans]|uniref:SP-RING-type domain-containing protein n=1 Tax=Phytophthora infestans TaxID=4787 RepID=A0A8S9U8Z1_PHYIN|nr:hypothetical protein GN958_ATG13471 [Phytophthora infestans]
MRQFHLMQHVANRGKTLQLKEATSNYLQQQLNEALSAYRKEHQRADQLKLEIGSRQEQNQREQAFRAHIQRQVQQLREQHERVDQLQREIRSEEAREQCEQALKEHAQKQEQHFRKQHAALTEIVFQLAEQQKIRERIQRSRDLFEMRLKDENVPSVYTCSQEKREATMQNDTGTTVTNEINDVALSARLNEQLCGFEHERAQLLEQASNAVAAHRSHREAAMTCPISRDLFVDPVVTECCGKTLSSQALMQSLKRSSVCPLCSESDVRIHPNHDMSILVQLHRSEYSMLDNVFNNQPAHPIEGGTYTTEKRSVPARCGRRSRRDSDSLRESTRQERRSQRLQGRSTASCWRSST